MRVLHTDVCLAVLRGNQRVIQRRQAILDEVVTTWMTAAELFYMAATSKAPTANRALILAFLGTLRVMRLEPEAAERFGTLKMDTERMDHPLTDIDVCIACMALSQRAILVTGKPRDYRHITDLRVEDWQR